MKTTNCGCHILVVTTHLLAKAKMCCFIMERVEGIEPSQPGRKHGILPLNYTRIQKDYTIKINKNLVSIKKNS